MKEIIYLSLGLVVVAMLIKHHMAIDYMQDAHSSYEEKYSPSESDIALAHDWYLYNRLRCDWVGNTKYEEIVLCEGVLLKSAGWRSPPDGWTLPDTVTREQLEADLVEVHRDRPDDGKTLGEALGDIIYGERI